MAVNPSRVHPAILAQHNTLLRAVNQLLVHHINTVKSQPQTFNQMQQGYNPQYLNRATAHPQRQTNAYGQAYSPQSQSEPAYYMAPFQRAGRNINNAIRGFVNRYNLTGGHNPYGPKTNPWGSDFNPINAVAGVNPMTGKGATAFEGEISQIAENYPGGLMGFVAGRI